MKWDLAMKWTRTPALALALALGVVPAAHAQAKTSWETRSIALDAYTLSDVTAKRGDDGSVAVQFGGWDGSVFNCLPITPGWNYLVRLYRPRQEILSGKWKFPEPQPAS